MAITVLLLTTTNSYAVTTNSVLFISNHSNGTVALQLNSEAHQQGQMIMLSSQSASIFSCAPRTGIKLLLVKDHNGQENRLRCGDWVILVNSDDQ